MGKEAGEPKGMKIPWKYVALLTAVVVVACTKEWPARKAASLNGKGGDGNAVFASEWTTISKWKKDQKGFFAEQSLKSNAQKGKVLLFARNLWAADSGYNGDDMPLQLPLNFLPYNDQPGLTETWQYELQGNKLRVNLEVAGVEKAEPREVAVRYVVIPDEMWQELSVANPDTASMPYEDLVAKLDIKP
ncbi:hypothetical protein SAMN05444008_102242 [Cnuella takakiae]|uniref:Uncharacterized protein n=2 Tax=Cnuella takakiae TaxID=1302690 RepID=A0A1M4VET8_9BACT|nr:hypothetical protein SAMN05444008_102242 [Cnuella takakiae]